MENGQFSGIINGQFLSIDNPKTYYNHIINTREFYLKTSKCVFFYFLSMLI